MNKAKDTFLLSAAEPLAEYVTLTMPDSFVNRDMWISLAEDLIKNQPLPHSAEMIRNVLTESKQFKNIAIDTLTTAGTKHLVVTLTPYRIIRDIKIKGQYPLFKTQILRVMSLHYGSFYSEETALEQKLLITRLYVQEGFTEVSVTVEVKNDKHAGFCELLINIEKGTYSSIGSVVIKGNRAFTDARLKTKMQSWLLSYSPLNLGRYNVLIVKKDMELLEDFYHNKGFYDCSCEYTTTFDAESNKAHVNVIVNEGQQYKVVFFNNEPIPRRMLLKEMTIQKEGGKNAFILKQNMKRLERYYLNLGYNSPQISYKDTITAGRNRDIRTINITINKRIRPIVSTVTIDGNSAFDDKTIRGEMLTGQPGTRRIRSFSFYKLEKDILSIKALYLKSGYNEIDADYTLGWSPDSSNVSVTVKINEARRSTISSIIFTGLTAIPEYELRKAISLGENNIYHKINLKNDQVTISRLIGEKGYPYVVVDASVISDTLHGKVTILFTINEGPLVTIGNIYYRGAFKTRPLILNRELKLKTGQPLALTNLLNSQKNLANLDILSGVTVKPFGLKEKQSTVTMIVEIDEKKPYRLSASGGFETEKGLYSQAQFVNINLLGLNKAMSLGGNISMTGRKIEFNYLDPRTFGFPTVTSFDIFIEQIREFNKDFGVDIVGSSLGLKRKIYRPLSANASVIFERRALIINSNVDSSIMAKEQYQPRNRIVASPSLTFDSRDSFVRPRKGFLSMLKLDISKGFASNVDDFWAARFDTKLFLTLIPKTTFALRARLGYLRPYNNNIEVPKDQMFYLGGTYDVRGFKENLLFYDSTGAALGGRVSQMGSFETRYDLGRKLELSLFYDIGRISDTFSITSLDNFRSSAGFGLRYITPIGPIGVLYGFKINPNSDEEIGRFHFSLGYTF